MKEKDKTLGVYIHIPFCVRKCLYCDFLSAPASHKEIVRYVAALVAEIIEESKNYITYKVDSVFLGGGTPSLLPGKYIIKILDAVYCHFKVGEHCEISMEVNPGTVTAKKLLEWKRSGVNRISIGVQSLVDDELRALGRIHTSEDFFNTYEAAVKSGFNNINVDLMSAIPCQTLASYTGTLRKIIRLEPMPKHISAYSLIVEEGTPFYENTPELPDEDCEREMYKITHDILLRGGYHQYEISNYALGGYECRHNKRYWRRGNYVGFGIGAASMVDNVRFQNTHNINSYINHYLHLKEAPGRKISEDGCLDGVKETRHRLSKEEQMEEFMFLGLRMMKGVSLDEFFHLFGVTMEQVYPGIVEEFCQKGLLQRKKDAKTAQEWVSLTRYGIDVSNVVMAQFLLA